MSFEEYRPAPANNDRVILFVPFEDGTRAYSELLTNFGRYRDLTLRSDF